MSALSFLVLCIVFVLLVLLYLLLLRLNSWRLSDASRRAAIRRWLQAIDKDHSPPSSHRIMELLNNHLKNRLLTKRTTVIDDLVSVSVVLMSDKYHSIKDIVDNTIAIYVHCTDTIQCNLII